MAEATQFCIGLENKPGKPGGIVFLWFNLDLAEIKIDFSLG